MEGTNYLLSVFKEFAENCMICPVTGKTFNLAGTSGCIFVRNGERRSALLDEISKALHPNWLGKPPWGLRLPGHNVERLYEMRCMDGEMLAVLNENKEMLVQFLMNACRKCRPVEMEGTYLHGLISGLAGSIKDRSGLCSRKPSFL